MSERELDIVEELRFFAEASDEPSINVLMISGATFTAAADEIERLREELALLRSNLRTVVS